MGNKEVLIPLQAADLIAYETRKVGIAAWAEARRLGTREPHPQPMKTKLLQALYSKNAKQPTGACWRKS